MAHSHDNPAVHSAPKEPACCHGVSKAAVPVWWNRFWIRIAAASILLLGASYVFPALQHFRHAYLDYVRVTVLPVLAGFFIGGIIDYFIPREYITKLLGQGQKRTVLYAAGLGFLMSACSHGILALSMELHKKGASGPAVITFLLASPWANLPVTLLLIGFFGARGFLIIGGALLVALVTGYVFQKLAAHGLIEKNPHTSAIAPGFSIHRDLARRWKARVWSRAALAVDARGIARGMAGLADMVLGWLLLGMLLAGLAAAFVPAGIFEHYFGASLLGLLVTLAAATVLEVCSEGTAPLAFEIYRQTGAVGNAFVFLMGGVVTDYTEIGLVWSTLGRRTALWMIAVTLPQVFALGWLMNVCFR